MRKLFLSCFLLLLLTATADAAKGPYTTYYVAQTATGDGSGVDASNLMSIAIHNGKAADYFAGGDTLWILDNFTTNITPKSSGSAGNPLQYRGDYPGHPCSITTATTWAVLIDNAVAYITLWRIKITGGGLWTVKGGANNIILNYCKILGHPTNYGVSISEAATSVTMNNCNVAYHAKNGINVGATSTLNVYNCRIFANVQQGILSAGTCNVYTSIETGNGNVPGSNYSAANITRDATSTSLLYSAIKHTSPKVNSAYFCWTSDDSGTDAWVAWDAALRAAGSTGQFTIFMDMVGWVAGDTTNMQTLVASGHDVGVHGRSHSDLTVTEPFTLTSTNTNPTIDVDVATTTIALSCDEVGNRVTYDYSGDKSILQWVTDGGLVAKGWTVTMDTSTSNLVRLKTLADTAGAQAVGAGYSPLYDLAEFRADEIGSVKTWIQTNLSITPVVGSFPFGFNETGVSAYRTATLGEIAHGYTNDPTYLSWLNRYNIGRYQIGSLLGDGTEAQIRAYARSVYVRSVELGRIFATIIHPAEMTADQVTWWFTEVESCGGTWMTLKDAITEIIASHTTTDDIIYTNTYADVSDHTLLASDPGINKGTPIAGVAADFAGLPIKGLPDIGAHEYQSRSSGGSLLMW